MTRTENSTSTQAVLDQRRIARETAERGKLEKRVISEAVGLIWQYGNIDYMPVSWKYSHPILRPGRNATPYIELGMKGKEGRPYVARVSAEFGEPSNGHTTGDPVWVRIETQTRDRDEYMRDRDEIKVYNPEVEKKDDEERREVSDEQLREALQMMVVLRERYILSGLHPQPSIPDPDHP